MKWIDFATYTGNGGALDETTFNSLGDKAEQIIDLMTNGKLGDMSDEEYAALPDFVKNRVAKAVGAQIDYFDGMGTTSEPELLGSEQSVTLGAFSYTKSGQSGLNGVAKSDAVSSYAESFLTPTGLLYAGVHIRRD